MQTEREREATMADPPLLGAKLRALRRRENLTQVDLAERLGISASYLNLIENNRRPLTAPLLIRLAQIFQLDLHAFAASEDSRLVADLLEAFGDPIFDSHGLTNADLRELAVTSPNVARAVITLYRSYGAARDSVSTLGERLTGADGLSGIDASRLPSEEVTDLVQRHMNHFPELEEAAERLWRQAELDAEDVYRGLVRYLAAVHRIHVKVVRVADERKAMRRYDPERRVISVSEVLPPRSRRFQLALQVGLITQSEILDRLVRDEQLTTTESRALARVALANYFAAALLMPYQPFLEAARAERYDIELLAHRFGASFEQVCHRLTTLRRPGAEGVPLHFLRIDIAGNISKRFSGSGIRFARFSGACPRWNVHAAFMTPGMIRIQLSRMPDGNVYFCIARTVRSDRGGYHTPHTVQAIGLGCDVRHARELVYADGIDVEDPNAAVPVGVTCRILRAPRLRAARVPRAHPPAPHRRERTRGLVLRPGRARSRAWTEPGAVLTAGARRASPRGRIPPASAGRRQALRALAPVDALQVLALLRVDLDPLALLDEERHVHHGAGGHRGGLRRAAGGVTLHPGLAGADLQRDVRRQIDADRQAVEDGDVEVHAVAEPLGVVADLVARHVDLLTGLGVHEHEVLALGVDVLELTRLDVGGLQLLARLVGPFEHGARRHVLDLDPGERLPLAGLDELEVDDGVRLAVHHHLEAFADVARVHADWFL